MKREQEDKLYERETHLSYNELENHFEIETYDIKIVKRFMKNKSCEIKETKTDVGTLYFIKGSKKDLNLDIY